MKIGEQDLFEKEYDFGNLVEKLNNIPIYRKVELEKGHSYYLIKGEKEKVIRCRFRNRKIKVCICDKLYDLTKMFMEGL